MFTNVSVIEPLPDPAALEIPTTLALVQENVAPDVEEVGE